jgi:hypothetical protein
MDGHSVIFITWDESDFTGTGPEGFWDTAAATKSRRRACLTLVISERCVFGGVPAMRQSLLDAGDDRGQLAPRLPSEYVRPPERSSDADLVGPVGGF